MTQVRGFFQLSTPDDLLAKLEWDFLRMNKALSDPYAAFDFFVTAEHMRDWLFPGKEGRKQREALRESSSILQMVSHIATGAKHLVPESPQHVSVRDVDGPTSEYPHAALVIYPADPVVAELGILGTTTLGLAQMVLDYWRGYLKQRGPKPPVAL